MTRAEFFRRRRALGAQQFVGVALGLAVSGAQVHVSRMENGVRPISRTLALALRCLEDNPALLDPHVEP